MRGDGVVAVVVVVVVVVVGFFLDFFGFVFPNFSGLTVRFRHF